MIAFVPVLRRGGGLLVASLCLLVLAPSCSEESGPPVPEVDQGLFLEELSGLLCKRRDDCACSEINSSNPEALPSGAACLPATQARLRSQFRLEGEAPLRFDGTCAALFLQEFASTVGCSLDLPSLYQQFRCTVGCSVSSGELAAGQSCGINLGALASECSGTLLCSPSTGTCQSFCPASAGEICGFDPATSTSRSCASGSFCDCSGPHLPLPTAAGARGAVRPGRLRAGAPLPVHRRLGGVCLR